MVVRAVALIATFAIMAQAEKGEVILITGASSGIGRATAKFLAASGYRVIATARREAKLKTLVEEIEADGGVAAYIPMDVTKDGLLWHCGTRVGFLISLFLTSNYFSADDTAKALAFGDEKFGGIDHFFLVCQRCLLGAYRSKSVALPSSLATPGASHPSYACIDTQPSLLYHLFSCAERWR